MAVALPDFLITKLDWVANLARANLQNHAVLRAIYDGGDGVS